MQRLGRLGFWPGFTAFALPMAAGLAVGLRFTDVAREGGLLNPDSFMRMVRLRDMLDSGHTVYAVARDGSGHGTLLHWSHLIDSLLTLLALPMTLFMGQNDAVYLAALLFAPLGMGALGLSIAWAAAPFAERKWLFAGAVLAPLSSAIASYGMVGVVHHHVPIVAVAVMACGWAGRILRGIGGPGAGLALGAWGAVGIWMTPETVPLTMLTFGALFLGWIVYPARDDIARAIGLTGIAFLLVATAAMLADPPASGWGAVEIDRISILFAAMAAAVAATGIGLWAAHRFCQTRAARTAAAIAIGLGCCAPWAAGFRSELFLGHLSGGAAQYHAFFDHISEMRPVSGFAATLRFLLTGALAVLVLGAVAIRLRSLLIGYAALCVVALVLVGHMHVRFAAYPAAAGAIALPIALTLAGRVTAAWPPILQTFTRVAAFVLFIQAPFMGHLSFAPGAAQAAGKARMDVPPCRPFDAAGLLAGHDGAVVLTDVSDSPEILYHTKVLTVGSLYHRNQDGFGRLRAAWRTVASDTVPPEIAAADISLVLACKTPMRSMLVADLDSLTLFDQVRQGQPPVWLKRIADNTASGHTLYEVVRQ